jgi:uncharacterized membrane protein YagU involved in acid resistance
MLVPKEMSMNRMRHPALVAALLGGFVAGTLDVGVASLITGYSPLMILKYIACGLLGKSALAGSLSVAALGLLLQWAVSIIIAAVFVLVARRHIVLTRNWLIWGGAYGVLIFFVMNYVVVPLSALHAKPLFSAYSFIANFAAMLVFGCIVAFTTKALLMPSEAA